jgi:hypothetical protein
MIMFLLSFIVGLTALAIAWIFGFCKGLDRAQRTLTQNLLDEGFFQDKIANEPDMLPATRAKHYLRRYKYCAMLDSRSVKNVLVGKYKTLTQARKRWGFAVACIVPEWMMYRKEKQE